jgi:very-short-patch-repair endonuclease
VLLEGIPCTCTARTIADLAGVEPEREVRRLLEQSLVLQIFDARAFDEVLEGADGRCGTSILRRLLAELNDEPAPTSSELERLLLDLVRAARLERPIVNGYVEGLQVDFHWPVQRLVVEVDGRRFHGHTVAIERDRDRDLRLQPAGCRVARLTWRQVVNEPERVAHLLQRLLST